MTALIVATALLSVVYCLYIGVRSILRAWPLLQATATTGTDDATSTIPRFIELLNGARRSMLIYDDGNDVDEPLYDNDDVIDAVEERLSDPSFELHCFFVRDHKSRFMQKFRDAPRVWIRTAEVRTASRARQSAAIRYAILDGGKKVLLSRRIPSGVRRFRLVDCTNVPEHALGYVTNAVLGDYQADLRRKFSEPPEGRSVPMRIPDALLLRHAPAFAVLFAAMLIGWGVRNVPAGHLAGSDPGELVDRGELALDTSPLPQDLITAYDFTWPDLGGRVDSPETNEKALPRFLAELNTPGLVGLTCEDTDADEMNRAQTDVPKRQTCDLLKMGTVYKAHKTNPGRPFLASAAHE